MTALLVGECEKSNKYTLVDTSAYTESEFEKVLVKAVTCLFPDYHCGVFRGDFVLEGQTRRPDLALLHRSLSHWFVIEVEVKGHSLYGHILPQVRCFKYGDPSESCVTSMQNAYSDLNLNKDDAKKILFDIPREVAVIGNHPESNWEMALAGVGVQLITVSVYANPNLELAFTITGDLSPREESLGFATYDARLDCLRLRSRCELTNGPVQIKDQFGGLQEWIVECKGTTTWIRKTVGHTFLPNDRFIQLLRSDERGLRLRISD